MMTPDSVRLDAMKLDAYLEAFEHTYLHFLEIGHDEQRERDRGTFAFYEIRDKIEYLIGALDELSGHMAVCNAISAANRYRT